MKVKIKLGLFFKYLSIGSSDWAFTFIVNK